MPTSATTPDRREQHADPHSSVHGETGGLPGEQPGRSRNPLVKVAQLAWLEFEKPDLAAAERFALDFGFVVADRTRDRVWLRGRWAGSPCLSIRQGARSGFVGPAFAVGERSDLDRLARALDAQVTARSGGHAITVTDPSGFPVTVVHDAQELPSLPQRDPLTLNFGPNHTRTNQPQRPPSRPAEIERLGHVVLGTTKFAATLNWYLDTLGVIVSDFLFIDGQRDRGPTMAFIRCDLGTTPTDHHTLAIVLQPATGYVHSAYQLTDLDEVATAGEYLRQQRYRHSWGIGRHIQGSQIFDYWRDRDGLMFEHYTDGDLFDASVEPGWAPMSASGLAQWGPEATRDFLGTADPVTAVAAIKALRETGNDIDLTRLRGLVKAMSS